MTRGFWRDPERYIQTYWSRFPGIWVHGDWAAIDDDGLWYILGRSDDTIKVAGKRRRPGRGRIGARGATRLSPWPRPSACPSRSRARSSSASACLRRARQPQRSVACRADGAVVEQLGKPLKPREIKFVAALPRTRNAKVMHRIIRAAYLGQDPGDISSLEDPAAVEAIRNAL